MWRAEDRPCWCSCRRLGIALALLGLLACDRQPSPAVERWIAEPAQDELRLSDLGDTRAVFSWTFTAPGGLDAWTTVNLRTITADAAGTADTAGTEIVTLDEDPHLWRKIDVRAASIDTVVLELRGFVTSEVKLFWARQGDAGFAEERQITLLAPIEEVEGVQRFRFAVAEHPLWKGQLTDLRIDPCSVPDARLRLVALRGEALELAPNRLRQAAKRPWRVQIDHEVRDALLVGGGAEQERRLRVPPGGRLRFGLATLRHHDAAPPRLAVTVDGELVARPTAGGAIWIDHEIDLEPWAGREIRLSLTSLDDPEGKRGDSDGEEGEQALLAVASPRLVAATPHDLPHVVVISIDTLRADYLSAYGHPRPTSPAIDRLAAGGTLFREVVAAAPRTLPAHASLFTGLDALRHGANYPTDRLDSAPAVLAELLARRGYTTLALTGGAYLDPLFGLDRGFHRYRYWPNPGDDAEELTTHLDRALAWVRELGSEEPLFLFLHTYEVHSPYRLREPFFSTLGGDRRRLPAPEARLDPHRGDDAASHFRPTPEASWRRPEEPGRLVSAEELDLVAALYEASIAYTDAQLARLFARLAESRRPVLTVLTSDHGESFGEQGLLGHGNLLDGNLLVPLIVHYPGRVAAGRRVAAQVATVDLLPTILDLVGAAAPAGIDGRSLSLGIAPGDSNLADDLLAGEPTSNVADGGGRGAWAAAAGSNRGLLWRSPTGRRTAWNDTPWGPHDAAPETAALRRYRARHSRGLLLEIDGREPFALRLAGPRDLVTRLKTLDPVCAEIEHPAAGHRFRVPTGCSFRLILEASEGETLALTLEGEHADQHAELFVSPPLAAGAWCRTADGWEQRARAAGCAGSSLTFSWQGAAGEPSPGVDVDGELREQLEALGYAG